MSTVEIRHDAFARSSLMRRTVQASHLSCRWCGGQRKGGKLYEYGTHSDGSYSVGHRNINWHRGLYCSKGCHDSYHA